MDRKVEFNSKGSKVVGILSTPATGKPPFPTVVMAGGWCYVKEIVMPHYAKKILDAGVAVLRFDYRNFGESEGEPRQHIDPWAQIEDYKNAVSFAMTCPEVDANRVGIWGISYSGGHVLIVGATDRRVRCVVSNIPVVDGLPTMKRCHGERKFERLMNVIMEDRVARSAGKAGDYMPMSAADPDTTLSTWPFPHVYEIFLKIKEREAPRHEHRNTIESTELLLNYTVFPYVGRILNTPTLMVVAENDNITLWDLEIAAFNGIATANKKLVVLPDVTHMSLYSTMSHLEIASTAGAKFLSEQLGA